MFQLFALFDVVTVISPFDVQKGIKFIQVLDLNWMSASVNNYFVIGIVKSVLRKWIGLFLFRCQTDANHAGFWAVHCPC